VWIRQGSLARSSSTLPIFSKPVNQTAECRFEGFFALLIALFKDLPHWIYLTAYHSAEIANAIHQFINRDIQALTDGMAKNDREFVSMAVYATYEPQEAIAKEEWDVNLDNIAWLIRHMAEKYMASRDEYNSYKHGLRAMTGESSLGMALNNPAGQPGPLRTVAHSLDAFHYLELVEGTVQTLQDPETKETAKVFKSNKEKADEETDERIINEVDVPRVYEMTKFFNPKQSLTHLSLMNRLLATIKNTRLAYYTDKGQPGPLMTLFNLDRDEIIALREKYFEFRVSI
jgi:hypothetical protein